MTYYKNYNIYYGTIGNDLKLKYRYTKKFKSDEDALEEAKNQASSLFYKNEGKHGIPKFLQIKSECDITGLSIEDLYSEHINDMCRWYAIPTSVDTIPERKLKFD